MSSKVKLISQQLTNFTKIPQARSSMKATKGGETSEEPDKSSETTLNIFSDYRKTIDSTINKDPYQPSAQDYQKILIENEGLKKEINRLHQILGIGFSRDKKSCERAKTEIYNYENSVQDERNHFKKVIQKSYFSIKEMQKQIQMLNKNLEEAQEKIQISDHKYRILELQNHSLKTKLSDTGEIHKEEISFCTDRIRKLEFRIEQLVNLMEEDQYQWRKHQQDLHKLKKFYFTRTSH